MKRTFFRSIAQLNKIIIPRYSQRDLMSLSKIDKALIGYRYYITKKALEK